MSNEHLWKKRFLALTLVRLAGTALSLLGMAVAFGDLVKPGGSRLLGIALIVAGLIGLAILPKRMSRRWRQP